MIVLISQIVSSQSFLFTNFKDGSVKLFQNQNAHNSQCIYSDNINNHLSQKSLHENDQTTTLQLNNMKQLLPNIHKTDMSEISDLIKLDLINLDNLDSDPKSQLKSLDEQESIIKNIIYKTNKISNLNTYVTDDKQVLTGSDDAARLQDRVSGKCVHKITPDFKQYIMSNPRLLVSPVSAVNMNEDYIAVGYNTGDLHCQDKSTGKLRGVSNVSGIDKSKISKIMFKSLSKHKLFKSFGIKDECQSQLKTQQDDDQIQSLNSQTLDETSLDSEDQLMDNCDFDSFETTVIIAVSGGKVSVINTDDFLMLDGPDTFNLNQNKVKPAAEIDTRNFCGWDGNCRIGEPDISDVEFDTDSLKMQIATENKVYQFSAPQDQNSLPDVTQTFSKAVTSMNVQKGQELICGLEDGKIQIIDLQSGRHIKEINEHDSQIEYVRVLELKK